MHSPEQFARRTTTFQTAANGRLKHRHEHTGGDAVPRNIGNIADPTACALSDIHQIAAHFAAWDRSTEVKGWSCPQCSRVLTMAANGVPGGCPAPRRIAAALPQNEGTTPSAKYQSAMPRCRIASATRLSLQGNPTMKEAAAGGSLHARGKHISRRSHRGPPAAPARPRFRGPPSGGRSPTARPDEFIKCPAGPPG